MPRSNVFYTGVTNYNPEKCFNGYTLIPARGSGALLIDMNGKAIRLFKNIQG